MAATLHCFLAVLLTRVGLVALRLVDSYGFLASLTSRARARTASWPCCSAAVGCEVVVILHLHARNGVFVKPVKPVKP